MNCIPYNSFLQHIGADILHLENNIINCSALWAESSIDWERSCLYSIRTERTSSFGMILQYQKRSSRTRHQHLATDSTFLSGARNSSDSAMLPLRFHLDNLESASLSRKLNVPQLGGHLSPERKIGIYILATIE